MQIPPNIPRTDFAILMAYNLFAAGMYNRILIISNSRSHYDYWARQGAMHLGFVWNKTKMQLTTAGGDCHIQWHIWYTDIENRLRGSEWDMSLSVCALSEMEIEYMRYGTRLGPMPQCFGVVVD